MPLSDQDKIRAIKISQALQEYFEKDPANIKTLRSTDAYEILVKKELVEKDRHHGIKFREFLHKLKNNNSLDLIPQCRYGKDNEFYTNWYFESTPAKTIRARNLRPLNEIKSEHTINDEEILEKVNRLPKRDISQFTQIQLETRRKYPRAYEFWNKAEDELLLLVADEIKDTFRLSKLFGRQPSAIQMHLKEKFGIEL